MLGVAPSLLVGVDVGVRKGSKQRGARPLQLTRRGGRLLRSLRDRSFTLLDRIETVLHHLPGAGGQFARYGQRYIGERAQAHLTALGVAFEAIHPFGRAALGGPQIPATAVVVPPCLGEGYDLSGTRSEESRVGKACLRTCSARWLTYT